MDALLAFLKGAEPLLKHAQKVEKVVFFIVEELGEETIRERES